jgi:uncharacterized membrane protein YcaP (DUF421 family)
MDLTALVLRTFFIYFFILLIMRVMGKREIGKLSIFDLVVSIMIAELAVLAVERLDVPLLVNLLPIIVLFVTQIVLSYISLKSKAVRQMVDGTPSVLIEHGQIKEKEMRKQRYNLDDLLMQLRENNIHSLSQVETAILEPSGKLTVVPRYDKDLSESGQALVLIEDGLVNHQNLDKIGKNIFWLKQEIKRRTGTSSLKNVSFCSLDQAGSLYIDLDDKENH